MEAQSFRLTRYTDASYDRADLEKVRLSKLRSAIRDAIARGIGMVLDEERFHHRVTQVIADSSGFPNVASYVVEPGQRQLAYKSATQGNPAWLPKRLPLTLAKSTTPFVIPSDEVFGARDGYSEASTVVIPLHISNDLEGTLLIVDVVASAISEDDMEAFAVVADEIAPAVRVARIHQQARVSSVVDPDTGAFTYDFFMTRLEEEISRSQRTDHSVTIVLVEATDFDEFEAAAGYDVADGLLKDLASGFRIVMRTSDVVARRGRTGYALLLPDSDVDGASVTIDRIEARLARVDSNLEESGYTGPKPGIVAGSATYPTDGQTSAELVLAADQRLLGNSTQPDQG